jgi:hypothetical protein
MANDKVRGGLIPLQLKKDGVHVYKCSTGLDIYIGAVVALSADGIVVQGDAVTNTEDTSLLGVAVGFLVDNAAPLTTKPFLDVSEYTLDNAYVMVADDPDQEYVIEEDTGSTALTQSGAGNAYYGAYDAASGNTTTGWSTLRLDRSTGTTTTSGVFIAWRPSYGINSDGTPNAVGNYCKWIVTIANPQKGSKVLPTTTGAV